MVKSGAPGRSAVEDRQLPQAKHAVLIRGIGLERQLSQRPVLLGMRDQDFPERFFADLGRPSGRLSTAKPVDSTGGVLHLLQPVQRTVQVAMIDVACDTVGQPRLSPLRVESAGLVIRRIPLDPQTRAHRHDQTLEAWMQNPDGKFGWVQLNRTSGELDPDPARRPSLFSGQAELDRLLSDVQMRSALTETFGPAFVTPPDVCERLGRTLVFAAIPTASSDVSDQPPVTLDYRDGTLRQQMPPLMLSDPSIPHRAPLPGATVTPQYMSADYCNQNGKTDFLVFANLLQVVAIELRAFELQANTRTPEGQALVDALNRRSVTFGDGSRVPVGNFLATANTQLLESASNTSTLNLPTGWDNSTADDEAAVLAAAENCLRVRSAKVFAPEGRFQDHTRLYRLRVFLRVRGHDDCPLDTLWSEYSEPFEIAPWYESAGMIGPPVPLPRPTQAFLKAAKPNVAFVVPDLLMNAAQGASLSQLGKGIGPPSGPAISWICAFNIPIISICAFIVLSIFLSLLNLVFWWLPFVKICIPIPTAAVPKVGGDS